MYCDADFISLESSRPIRVALIKDEIEENRPKQCRACLSVGRKLIPLGEFARIYWKITLDFGFLMPTKMDEIHICWECHRLLQKVAIFQQRVEKANELIQYAQNYVYGSLSTLTKITMNESNHNTIYVNEETHTADVVKDEIYKEFYEQEFNLDNSVDDIDNTGVTEEIYKIKQNVIKNEKIINKRKLSRWAEKRKKENSKPKYRVITDFKFKFRRVQIDFQELQAHKSGRDSCAKWKCGDCFLSFAMESEYLKHVQSCHNQDLNKNPNLYICDICSAYFDNKRHLLGHLKKHYYIYHCDICPYSCIDKRVVKEHIRNNHMQVLECLKCGLRFGNCREFHKHHKDYHERYICDYCGVSFKMRYCIKEHIRKQHTKFECKQCNKQFARYNGLWLHNKTRHTESAGSAYCVECNKEYVDIYRYRWHLANSVKHKPAKKNRYPCDGCEKVFTKKIYMKDHYNFVHLKHYKYHCDACDKNFVRNPDLVKHRKRVHEGVLPPKNKICYICGRGFSTNKILVNHVRTHTGARPHACARCPAAFAQRAALAAHTARLHAQH